MLNVKSPAQALEIILSEFPAAMPVEEVPLGRALGRTLAMDMVSQEYVPGFDRSSVDGYAVVSADTFGCSDSLPAMLECVGEVLIGQKSKQCLERGECMYVPTGGEIPPGADAMVMVEHTEDYGDGLRYISQPTHPGAHLVFKGDDVSPGKTVLATGSKLRPQDIGVMAALGYDTVPVRKKPRVGILSTGDELVDIHSTPQAVQVRDINSSMLYASVLQAGGEPDQLGICPDDYEVLKNTVAQAIKHCDLLLISGGSSAGTRDATCKVIDALGSRGVLLHGIAIKPGKPTLVGEIECKPVFGLPGHPVSAYYVFHLFVRPLIDALLGAKEGLPGGIQAKLGINLPSNHGREEYVSIKLQPSEDGWLACPVYGKSGMITMLSEADGYVRLARDCEGLASGTTVTVMLF